MVTKLLEQILEGESGTARSMTAPEMEALARSINLDALCIEGFCKARPECYTRNRVHLNDHFELVVICWKPGQESAIHDHGVSNCLYLVVEGEMVEDRFRPVHEGDPEPTDSKTYRKGEITMSNGSEIHRIANRGSENLVTLHIYSPPLDTNVTMFTPIPRATNS